MANKMKLGVFCVLVQQNVSKNLCSNANICYNVTFQEGAVNNIVYLTYHCQERSYKLELVVPVRANVFVC